MLYAIAEALEAMASWLRLRDPFFHQITTAYLKASPDMKMLYMFCDIPTRMRIERSGGDRIRLIPGDGPHGFDTQFRTEVGAIVTLVIDPSVRGYTFSDVRPIP